LYRGIVDYLIIIEKSTSNLVLLIKEFLNFKS